MAAFLFSQLIGLVRQILVLRAFGTSAQMDAFSAANRVSETLFVLVAGGALASAFIPTFTGLLTHERRRLAWKLASAVANLSLIILTVGAALAAVFAPQIVRYVLAPGFAADPGQVALTVQLLRLMLPSAVLFGLSGLVMAILNSNQVFLVPALTPSMYQIGLIFGVLVLVPRQGIFGLGWGVLIGASLHLALQIPTLLRQHGRYIPTLGLDMPEVGEVARLMGPRLLGVAVVQLNFWINTTLASGMPVGSLIAIVTAFTLMLMPQAAIAQSIATAAMPTFSAQYARGRLDEVRASLATSLRGVLLLSIPATLGLILLREPLIVLLYRGGAFDARSTELVSWALLWYAAGLVGHSLVEILSRAFYALHDTRTPVMVGSLAMGLNVVLSIGFAALFTRIGWLPHGGLALANSVATALEMVGLLILMRRRLHGLEGPRVLNAALLAGAATFAMSLGIWYWLSWAGDRAAWLVAVGGVALGGGIYGTGVWILRVSEVRQVAGALLRRVKRT